MGFFDRFRSKQPGPLQRVLASIEKHEDHVALFVGERRLSIDKLPADRVPLRTVKFGR